MPAMVVVPTYGRGRRRVAVEQVSAITCNRIKDGEEQYLVQWHTEAATVNPPLSWHSISELVRCLEHVQDYLDRREKHAEGVSQVLRKRKLSETKQDVERYSSPSIKQLQQDISTRSSSRSSSVSASFAESHAYSSTIDVLNGVVDSDDHGFIYCRPDPNANALESNVQTFPTVEMQMIALRAPVNTALILIRNTYVGRLAHVPGKPIHLVNVVDAATPSLRFRFISEYVLDEAQGVHRVPLEAQVGCQQCTPHMGRNIGCEYTKKCDCLEYAAVDESRITDPEMMQKYHKFQVTKAGSTMGFPKKFPYFAEGSKRAKAGCLVPFYLKSRYPIYECNDKCHCGPYCRNKNVQFGRTVELEIFRTVGGRGWGLRCRQDLYEGQFVDTYRGEVITDAEATRRERTSSKAKASYLYSLDKFRVSEDIPDKDLYVVDGEFMGGPAKFINHSCDPNCRQYTVSYNKHDPYIYDIALFACRFIPTGEELTFDYLDKDDDDDEDDDDSKMVDEPGSDAVPCLCGAVSCRKWLWT